MEPNEPQSGRDHRKEVLRGAIQNTDRTGVEKLNELESSLKKLRSDLEEYETLREALEVLQEELEKARQNVKTEDKYADMVYNALLSRLDQLNESISILPKLPEKIEL